MMFWLQNTPLGCLIIYLTNTHLFMLPLIFFFLIIVSLNIYADKNISSNLCLYFKSQQVKSMGMNNCKDTYMLPNHFLEGLYHLMILLGMYENIMRFYIYIYNVCQLKRKNKTPHNFIVLMIISLLLLSLNCLVYLLVHVFLFLFLFFQVLCTLF